MPNDLDLYSYYRGMFVYSKEIFKNSNETFILDRNFMSELVYSKVLGRKTTIKDNELLEYLNENEISLFLFTNSYENYIERNPEDKTITYTKEQYQSLTENFNLYYEKYKQYFKGCDKFNTSIQSIVDCVISITDKLVRL